jgi:holo-[acyl-carrier protein] synthase
MSSQIGIDLVDLKRFESSLNRTAGLAKRLFTDREIQQGSARNLSLHLAGRFAAKEALAKALGVPPGLSWQEVEVLRLESGRPSFEFSGAVLALVLDKNVKVSISHDGGFVVAMVIIESSK